tara:strand:- start:2121 stop:2297 length:177 start_codon:yes stop_codon:yes gene_type:complete
MKDEIKDTIEFMGVNVGAIGLSLTGLDSFLRTFILIATLIYSIQKIIHYTKNRNGINK